jgi:hypothetical protein
MPDAPDAAPDDAHVGTDATTVDGAVASDAAVGERELPESLPIPFSRPAAGAPVSAADVTAFTRRLTRLFRDVELFDWMRRVSFGADASVGPPFACWWTYYVADKLNDEVTLRVLETGVPDNLMGPSAQMLSSVAAAALLTGDPKANAMAKLLADCVTAQFQGFVFEGETEIPPLMARAVMVRNHTEVLDGGLVKHVDIEPWHYADEAGNTQSFEIRGNPYWGDIWVRNIRSKDDVAQLYSAAVSLRVLGARTTDAPVREAARTAHDLMLAFARDVFERGYKIATRGSGGEVYEPTGDLASFVMYDAIFPDAECTAKIATALFATQDVQGLDCGTGTAGPLEDFIVNSNAYNLEIARRFHVAATEFALLAGAGDAALGLLEGLATRADRDLARVEPPTKIEPVIWEGNLAVHLLRAAAAGLPLTADEVRYIHAALGRALDELEAWPHWRLWDDSVPDGTYPPQPFPGIGMWDVMAVFDACTSPLANPVGAPAIDCELLADVAAW